MSTEDPIERLAEMAPTIERELKARLLMRKERPAIAIESLFRAHYPNGSPHERLLFIALAAPIARHLTCAHAPLTAPLGRIGGLTLTDVQQLDPHRAHIIDMYCFGELAAEEIAELYDCSADLISMELQALTKCPPTTLH